MEDQRGITAQNEVVEGTEAYSQPDLISTSALPLCVNITASLHGSDTRFAHLENGGAHNTGGLRVHRDNVVTHQQHVPTSDTQGVLGFKRDQTQDSAM